MKNFYTKQHPVKFYFTLILMLLNYIVFSQTTYLVTSAEDNGPGTLREAIDLANQSTSRDSIHFGIDEFSLQTIYLETSLPEIVNPIVLDATTQIGYIYKSPQIIIDGNGNELKVFVLTEKSSGSLIKGFSIRGLGVLGSYADREPFNPYTIGSSNLGTAIHARETGDHIIEENLLGITSVGDTLYSVRYGIILENSANNLIGNENKGNVISGAFNTGITIEGLGSINNLVLGNLIGTNPGGTTLKPNFCGITIGENSQYNTIGGNKVKKRNVVSGNSYYGVLVAGSRNKIIGNFIGLDAVGGALGNRGAGIGIRYATSEENAAPKENTIGGFGFGERNVISANQTNNVLIAYASNNQILGNYIGTDTLGTKELFYEEGLRQKNGVRLAHSENNLISGNLISGNETGVAIYTESNYNRIYNNLIGLNATATGPLPNAVGIRIANTSIGNTVGGMNPGDNNTVAYNTLGGIIIKRLPVGIETGSVKNKFSGNSIFANGALGIDLSPDGITENDSDDSDSGQNNLQNFPNLKNSASLEGSMLKIEYRVTSSPQYSVYPITVEFFKSDGNRQGKEYLGSDTYYESDISKGRKGKSISLELFAGNTLNGGDKVVATATDAEGNTSEFGAEVDVTGGCAETTWYADKDNDGLGDINDSQSSCTQPEGYITNSDDCDDTDAEIEAGSNWYADSDNDGFGDPDNMLTSCDQPVGYVSNSEDCDDTDAAINPDATDVCNDCDTTNDADCKVECLGTDVITISDCTEDSGILWTLTNPGTCTVDVRWESRKTNESGIVTVPPGDASLTTQISGKGPTQLAIYWPDSNGNEIKNSTNASGAECAFSTELTSSSLEDTSDDSDDGLKVIPNPITDEGIWLHFAERASSSRFEINVYDLSGNRMAQTTVEVDARGDAILWEIYHGRWIPGIYILNAGNGDEMYQIKLMK